MAIAAIQGFWGLLIGLLVCAGLFGLHAAFQPGGVAMEFLHKRRLRRLIVEPSPSLSDVANSAATEIIALAQDAGFKFREDRSTIYAADRQRLEDEINIWLEFHMIHKGPLT